MSCELAARQQEVQCCGVFIGWLRAVRVMTVMMGVGLNYQKVMLPCDALCSSWSLLLHDGACPEGRPNAMSW